METETPMGRTWIGWGLALGTVMTLHAANPLKFDFGPSQPGDGYTHVEPGEEFTTERGFGFEAGAKIKVVPQHSPTENASGFITSEHPFFFSVAVPEEGNYRVTVEVGDADGESTTTIKAELRRLMIEQLHTTKGEVVTRHFVVNTRTPVIGETAQIRAGRVKLKAPRETTQEAWAWDGCITLEFNGPQPKISRLEIAPAETMPTLFLIGDSTVCDQSKEPYASWGQMLPRFLKPEIAVANHAESGETYRDSIGRRRLDKIISVMKPGDYLFMQFGHNDQKQIAAKTGGPFTTYREEIKKHVDAVRARGGIPVIVTPMERRNFAAGKIVPSLADYATAARASAQELGVALIDLNAMSISFYEALGRQKSAAAFATVEGKGDDTHHDDYGSYELAKCVVTGIRKSVPALAKFVLDEVAEFDPAHPDAVDTFAVPVSPVAPVSVRWESDIE